MQFIAIGLLEKSGILQKKINPRVIGATFFPSTMGFRY